MRRYKIEIKNKEYVIYVQELSANRFRVVLDDQVTEVQLLSDQDLAESMITPEILPVRSEDETAIERPAMSYSPPPPDALRPLPKSPSPALPPKPSLPSDGVRDDVRSPMPGVIQAVEVKPGERITRGQTLVVLEAMKMKNSIKSPRDGTISEVLVHPGQNVSHGDILVTFAKE
ncbi:MAG: biotin/lipoyl-containing protein [Syntrophobacteraceae bacterium]